MRHWLITLTNLKSRGPEMIKKIIPILFIFMFCCFDASFARIVPPREGYVTDLADVIGSTHKAKIKRYSEILKRKTGVELAVLTIKSLEGQSIDEFANKTFNLWKLGKKSVDDGILMVVSINDRELRIEVGYGIEPILPDAMCGKIIEKMIPFMQREWYGQAIYIGVIHIINQIANTKNVTITEFPDIKEIKLNNRSLFSTRTILFLIFAVFLPPFIIMNFLISRTRKHPSGYWYSGDGGFGGFGGFFDGGGGSFGGGGGSSGGGGASGGW